MYARGIFLGLKSQYLEDSHLFGDFLKTWDVNFLPEGYQDFFLMDVLRMDKLQILELGHFEYHEALNYSLATYRMRSMAVSKQKKPGETIHYNQPKGYDHDPKFVSQVN